VRFHRRVFGHTFPKVDEIAVGCELHDPAASLTPLSEFLGVRGRWSAGARGQQENQQTDSDLHGHSVRTLLFCPAPYRGPPCAATHPHPKDVTPSPL
jgi:hypothetical protein